MVAWVWESQASGWTKGEASGTDGGRGVGGWMSHRYFSWSHTNSIFSAQKSLEIPEKMPKHHPRSSVTAEFVGCFYIFIPMQSQSFSRVGLGPKVCTVFQGPKCHRWGVVKGLTSNQSVFSVRGRNLLTSWCVYHLQDWGKTIVLQMEGKNNQQKIHHDKASSINQKQHSTKPNSINPKQKVYQPKNYFNQPCFFFGWAEDMKDTSDRSTTCPAKPPRFDSRALRAPRHRRCGRWTFRGGRENFFRGKTWRVFLWWEKKVRKKSALNYQKYVDFFLSFCGLEGSSFLGRCRGLVGGT